MTLKLPLPSNFFKCPPLTTAETDRLKALAYSNAMDVVQKALVQDTSTITWSLQINESALKVYRGDDRLSPSLGLSRLNVATSEVMGTIDEVVELFRNDTTEQAKEYVARFGRDLLDAASLYTLAEPSAATPNEKVGITWYALRSPLKKVILERDACLLESHYEFELNGKRGWVRAMKSVNLMCCPDLQHALGLVRMTHTGTGHVFLESDRPGYITMAYVVEADFGGSIQDWAIDVAMKRRCRSLLDIELFLRENRLARGHFLSSHQLVPREARRQCFLCQKKFGVLFGGKTNCVKCGEVFCSGCNQTWTVKLCGVPTRIEACTKCSLVEPSKDSSISAALAGPPPEATPRQVSSSSSSTSTSSSNQHIQLSRHKTSASASSRGFGGNSATVEPPTIPFMETEHVKEKWIRELMAGNESLLALETTTRKGPPMDDADHLSTVLFSPTQLLPIQSARRGLLAPEDEIPQERRAPKQPARAMYFA
ncbi:Aste57867_912 [Aphanomyces stellatus]|uniref:Aste57867_912 protein n=1 Tax=Aphanomyces stellatus TaxID=120398 RepID=A0A485K939_9STRA|nr:hypothetical protein As57867_000911 [Aphanomyces stellatus]VFT78136.1 Aste57867_912 [Aphanomyces stellatus]